MNIFTYNKYKIKNLLIKNRQLENKNKEISKFYIKSNNKILKIKKDILEILKK